MQGLSLEMNSYWRKEMRYLVMKKRHVHMGCNALSTTPDPETETQEEVWS